MTGNLISGGQAIEAAGVATGQIGFGGISLPGFISDDSVMWTPLDDYHVGTALIHYPEPGRQRPSRDRYMPCIV